MHSSAHSGANAGQATSLVGESIGECKGMSVNVNMVNGGNVCSVKEEGEGMPPGEPLTTEQFGFGPGWLPTEFTEPDQSPDEPTDKQGCRVVEHACTQPPLIS